MILPYFAAAVVICLIGWAVSAGRGKRDASYVFLVLGGAIIFLYIFLGLLIVTNHDKYEYNANEFVYSIYKTGTTVIVTNDGHVFSYKKANIYLLVQREEDLTFERYVGRSELGMLRAERNEEWFVLSNGKSILAE